jgi:hypothetical protein
LTNVLSTLNAVFSSKALVGSSSSKISGLSDTAIANATFKY